MPFLVTSFKAKTWKTLLPILSPVELGATWCWSIFRPQPGLRAPGDAETTWVSFLLFQPLSWYSTHNFQTSIHYIHYAHISFCHCHQKMGLPLCCLFHLFWMVLKHFNMCLGSCCFCCRISGFLQNASHRSWCFQRIALTANHRHHQQQQQQW